MGLGQLLVNQDIVVFVLANKQRQKQTFVKRNLLRNPICQRQIKPVGYLQAWLRRWTRDYREQFQLAGRAEIELGDSCALKFASPGCLLLIPVLCTTALYNNKCTWILDSPIPNFAASWSRSEAEGYWLVAYAASSSSCWFLVYLMRFLLWDVGG